jgi:hypothetical protein
MLRHDRLGLLLKIKGCQPGKGWQPYSNLKNLNKKVMQTELLQGREIKTRDNRINYLWLNGERVIGIEGLEISQDCRLLSHMPDLQKEHRESLNSIINAALDKYCEEGICNDWAFIVEKAKTYLSDLGYCVKGNKISLELRQKIELTLDPVVKATVTGRTFTVADIWDIRRHGKVRVTRKFL